MDIVERQRRYQNGCMEETEDSIRKGGIYAIYHTDKPSYEKCGGQGNRERCQPACEKRGNLRVPWAERSRKNQRNENDYEPLETYGGKHRAVWRDAYAEILRGTKANGQHHRIPLFL